MIKTKQKAKGLFINEQDWLGHKKTTAHFMQNAKQDFKSEDDMLKYLYKQINDEMYRQETLICNIQEQITREQQINRKLTQEFKQNLGSMYQKVISDFEKTIEANLRLAKQMKIKHDQLGQELSIGKMQRALMIQKACLKQSIYDAILLQTQNVFVSLQNKKQQCEKIQRVFIKSGTQQQQMFNLKKKLNNELQDYKGNIRVYCRIRPNKSEHSIISATSDNTLKLTLQKDHIIQKQQIYEQNYFFQQIFAQKDSQDRVFAEISQLVQSSIDGKNVCIFAYGQTGSGKTYTLIGPQTFHNQCVTDYNQRGLTPRSIEYIFEEIVLSESFKWKYSAFLSIQQIYLQTIIDLIGKTTTTMDKIRQIEVFSAEEVETHLKQAKLSRKTAFTNMNQRSSRSHLIVSLRLEGVNQATNELRNGSLVLIDLAGSQRIKQSKVQGDNLKETQFINKSLSSLGTVINGIRRKSDHIPFRNSKLTHVLQRYLQGDSKTLMFVNVSPDYEDAFQTKISLSFAEGVRQCKFNKK